MIKVCIVIFRRLLFLSAVPGLLSSGAYAAAPLTLLLDWFPNPDQAPIFVAQAKGFFKQQGLTVKIIAPANPGDPLKFVAAGKAQLAITYQPQLLISVTQGLPLVRVATLINQPLGCLITQPTISTVADLAGKTVGYSSPGVDEAMLNAMLQSAGTSLSQVRLINVHYDLVQALLLQRVDAITGVQRNFEQLELQQRHFASHVFYPEQHGVPSYDEFIIISRKDFLHDPRLAKFLIALQQGMDYLRQHPQQSWQGFAQAYPAANNALNRASWFATLPYFAPQVVPFDKIRYQRFAQFMYSQHLITFLPAVTSYTHYTASRELAVKNRILKCNGDIPL